MTVSASIKTTSATFKKVSSLLLMVILLFTVFEAKAEDGYRAWLRYDKIEDAQKLDAYKKLFRNIVLSTNSPTLEATKKEIKMGLGGLLGSDISFSESINKKGTLLFATSEHAELLNSLGMNSRLEEVGEEGFLIEQHTHKDNNLLVIAANSDAGFLYGAFHLLRMIQTQKSLDSIEISSSPKTQHRILNHWDNLNRLVERGYAGLSLWDWGTLPYYEDPRYTDYARLNASMGINGTVLNNVNADPKILTPQFIEKVTALADIFRPYGIKVYLSINYQAPITIGGLETADPLNEEVIDWWAEKADEIYEVIPDFGGFLVKADSEGEPGPFQYNRNHAEGANVLADAVEPHDGIVIWRAFVYSPEQTDRFREAYDEFLPLDGKFKDNVILQIKNGPIDFQPREPYSPLFGQLPNTNTMLELQITQEYFGFSYHLAYMGTLFSEVLQTETYAKGEEGSTVGEVVGGEVFDYEHAGVAGVVNLGTDRNWTGHPFVQSSWYSFGRLAWDYTLSADEIADEWLRMTFNNKKDFIEPVKEIMMESREAGVNYRSPLGLTHLYAQGHHYGPAPWTSDLPRPDWTAVYYHKADEEGIGFDRTESGSNAIEQYPDPIERIFSDPETTPEDYLLWFHHVSWDFEMESGRTLWEELVHKYYEGVETVRWMQDEWNAIEGHIDEQRFEHVKALLEVQERDAVRWRNSCVLYFQTFSEQPIPEGYEKPEHDLEYYIEMENTVYVPDPRY